MSGAPATNEVLKGADEVDVEVEGKQQLDSAADVSNKAVSMEDDSMKDSMEDSSLWASFCYEDIDSDMEVCAIICEEYWEEVDRCLDQDARRRGSIRVSKSELLRREREERWQKMKENTAK